MVYAWRKSSCLYRNFTGYKNDNGLAVVMGHEVSHALAGHGNERISQAMMAQYGGQILGGSISNAQWASIFQQVYPIGSQVALLNMEEIRSLKQMKWDYI
jgi:Zn-dependent protease with chaperone function